MSGRRQIGNTFTVNTIDDPVDAFVVDLDNEMTSIVADENGDTTSAVSLSPLVRAYYGTQSVIASCTVTASADDADVSVSYNSTTHHVNISISAETNVNDVVTVTVTVVHATYGTRTATFVISKVKDGTSAFIQELLPSLDEISFARQADKSLSPASRNLTLSFKKTKGNETTIQSLSEAGLTVRWSTSSMPSTVSSGSGWGQGTSVSGITWDNVTMQVANSVDVSNIYIACFNSGGTLVDRETIPIIKDGQHGDDAPAAYASPEKISVPCSSNGDVKAEQTTSVLFSLKVGTHSATVTSVSCDSYPTNVVVTGVAAYAQTIKVPATQTASGISSGCTFTVTGTYDGKTFSAKVTVALIGTLQGSQGVRGKVGRFYYYAGDFNVNDGTTQFDVNDAESPFFSYNNAYWVYNPESNPSGGKATMSQMGTPSSSSASWKLMTSDLKYLITEAIFGAYAHFGSAIINGDWMLSQHGTRNGVASTEYTKFDPNYPNTDHTYQDQSHNFIPNYCVDLLTGATYQNSAVVRGTVYADSGYFNGSLRTTFHDISNESGWVYYSSSDQRPSGMGVGWNYLVGNYDNMCMLAKKAIPSGGTANNLHIRLPNTLSMIGRRVILYEMNQPPFSDGVSQFEIRQLNHAAFVGVNADSRHDDLHFQAVYGITICGGVVEFLAAPHPTDATICTWVIINIDGCIWNYTTTQ